MQKKNNPFMLSKSIHRLSFTLRRKKNEDETYFMDCSRSLLG